MTIMRNDDSPFVTKSHEREGERECTRERLCASMGVRLTLWVWVCV